jgi:hypothetical protein
LSPGGAKKGVILIYQQTKNQDDPLFGGHGICTPALAEAGAPFLFLAGWNEPAMTAIAIDGLMLVQPVSEPYTIAPSPLAFVLLAMRQRRALA